MQTHLFKSDDGNLYDTRAANWASAPLRTEYTKAFSRIENVAQFKATLRHGPHAWPGGYPCYFVTSDGEALSFEAAQAECKQIMYAIQNGLNDGWRVVAFEVNWEDTDLTCAHTNKPIESAYGS